MFPLGTVLFPGAPLQLQVFEPRYRELLTDCLARDATFGVVLIERGQEVGGGDQRADVGTIARILQTADLGDGRSALLAIGTRRVRVTEWLPDDPYPRAHIEEYPDDAAGDPTDLHALYATSTGGLRRLLALATELGRPTAPATFELPDDPGLGSHGLAALAPLGSFDAQRLLAAPDVASRLALLDELVDELRHDLERTLEGERDPE